MPTVSKSNGRANKAAPRGRLKKLRELTTPKDDDEARMVEAWDRDVLRVRLLLDKGWDAFTIVDETGFLPEHVANLLAAIAHDRKRQLVLLAAKPDQ